MPKCLICVAPHTANADFALCELAYWSIGRRAGFLMKETWFFWPMGAIFRALGGIPVPRKRGGHLTDVIVDKFNHAERMQLAVTPEGTRGRVCRWRTGFLHIAREANVPILLAVVDFATKTVSLNTIFEPSGDVDEDIRRIKQFYRATGAQGKHPESFCTDDQ